jgi:excisionase family DNA binding protein
MERLLTARELAEWWGMTPDSVLDMWQRGELPGFRLGRRRGVRFYLGEIEAYMETKREGPRVGAGATVMTVDAAEAASAEHSIAKKESMA